MKETIKEIKRKFCLNPFKDKGKEYIGLIANILNTETGMLHQMYNLCFVFQMHYLIS